MSRHSLRRNSRRFALALSLMLVAGAVAIPALAQGSQKEFSVAVDAELVECHLGDEAVECDWRFTVTFTNHSRNTKLGAARITVPGDLISELPDDRLEATDLGVAPGESEDLFFFEGTADCGGSDEDEGEYVFTDPEAKQANDFSGEPGNDLTFLPDDSSLEVDLCPFADFKNVVDCAGVSDCSIEEETYRASTLSNEGMMGLRIVNATEDATATAVHNACHYELVGDQRLGGAVAHLLPLGMERGEYITVTSTIPRSHVNTDVNRSPHLFQVCFASEKEADGELIPGTSGLYGPIILDDCEGEDDAPCVVDRSKVRADVVITYLIPAEDPWLM